MKVSLETLQSDLNELEKGLKECQKELNFGDENEVNLALEILKTKTIIHQFKLF